MVADVPMPGPAVRFDYQMFDPSSGRLYIAHMNADRQIKGQHTSLSEIDFSLFRIKNLQNLLF